MDKQVQPKNTGKVFDIAKPNKSLPLATSRPIITNNKPQQPDPMVKIDAVSDVPSPEVIVPEEPVAPLSVASETPDQSNLKQDEVPSATLADRPQEDHPRLAHNPADMVVMTPVSDQALPQHPHHRKLLIIIAASVLVLVIVVIALGLIL